MFSAVSASGQSVMPAGISNIIVSEFEIVAVLPECMVTCLSDSLLGSCRLSVKHILSTRSHLLVCVYYLCLLL